MFETISFVTTQLWRVRRCMQEPSLSDFAPDGKTVEDVSAMIAAAEAAKADVLSKSVRLVGARGGAGKTFDAAHAAAVRVHKAMRSRYRRHPAVIGQLRDIPKKDETVAATLTRMERTSEVWAKLPPTPGTTNPFQQGVMTLAKFEALRVTLATQHETCLACAQEFAMAQAALTGLTRELESFTQAVVAQGGAQYADAPAQRAWIDTIPTKPSTKAPRRAVIEQATSPTPGGAHLEYDAAHGTRFTLQHKGPTDKEYAVVAKDLLVRSLDLSELAAGEHSWIVIPRNSRGTGPASKPATVTIAAAQAA